MRFRKQDLSTRKVRSSLFKTILVIRVKPVYYRQRWPTATPIMSHNDVSKVFV